MMAMIVLVGAFALMYALWFCFLAVMALKHARDANRLMPWSTRLGYPILFAGYMLDFTANMLVMTILFAELPHEWLVTPRVGRHLKAPAVSRFRSVQIVREWLTPWRERVANWINYQLLDPIDPGHCK